jgi:hypothetical protein
LLFELVFQVLHKREHLYCAMADHKEKLSIMKISDISP